MFKAVFVCHAYKESTSISEYICIPFTNKRISVHSHKHFYMYIGHKGLFSKQILVSHLSERVVVVAFMSNCQLREVPLKPPEHSLDLRNGNNLTSPKISK